LYDSYRHSFVSHPNAKLTGWGERATTTHTQPDDACDKKKSRDPPSPVQWMFGGGKPKSLQ